jgi:hypothetical protein
MNDVSDPGYAPLSNLTGALSVGDVALPLPALRPVTVRSKF